MMTTMLKTRGTFLLSTAALALVLLAPARADACTDINKTIGIVQKVLDGFCELAGDKFDCTKIKDGTGKAKELLAKWNKAFKDSNLTIGPRNIHFGPAESGTLLAGTKRTFISTRSSNKKSVKVVVEKRDGKAADVSICTVDGKGKPVHVGKLSFAANDKNGTKKSFVINGAEGKVIIVQLDAKKMNKFAYNVDLDEK